MPIQFRNVRGTIPLPNGAVPLAETVGVSYGVVGRREVAPDGIVTVLDQFAGAYDSQPWYWQRVSGNGAPAPVTLVPVTPAPAPAEVQAITEQAPAIVAAAEAVDTDATEKLQRSAAEQELQEEIDKLEADKAALENGEVK